MRKTEQERIGRKRERERKEKKEIEEEGDKGRMEVRQNRYIMKKMNKDKKIVNKTRIKF